MTTHQTRRPPNATRSVHFSVDVDVPRAAVTLRGTLNTAAALAAAESMAITSSSTGRCVTLDLSDVTLVSPRAVHMLESALADLLERGVTVRAMATAGTLAHDVLRSESCLLDRQPSGRERGQPRDGQLDPTTVTGRSADGYL